MTRSQTIAVACGIVTVLMLIAVATGFLFFFARAGQARLTPVACNLMNRVEIPNDPALQFGPGPFSVSMWFRTTSQRKYISFVGKRISGLGDGWVIGANEQSGLSFYTAGCASPASSPQQFRDGRWHHLVVTRGGQTMTFYFDNQQVGSGPDTCDHNEVHPLRIGMDFDGGWNFEGELAEVHIYNRALTASDVAEEWNGGKARKSAVSSGGLIAGYHFGDRGAQYLDFSGHGHHGTLAWSKVPAEGTN